MASTAPVSSPTVLSWLISPRLTLNCAPAGFPGLGMMVLSKMLPSMVILPAKVGLIGMQYAEPAQAQAAINTTERASIILIGMASFPPMVEKPVSLEARKALRCEPGGEHVIVIRFRAQGDL